MLIILNEHYCIVFQIGHHLLYRENQLQRVTSAVF